ncbi:hypothetical protein B5M09_007107 [Aphanomyces astaci]|uniref:Chloride channel protein n=1 Tax=Aphanomyces astaci TaxID=112090 RepID=A0A3R7YKY7_APHAT|nr:hypothetical protein B5M09_007107 [Aphanomyces astaci]
MAYRPLSQHGGSTSHDSIQYESVEFVTYDARFTKGDLSHLQGDIAPPTFAPCGCGPTTFSWRNKMISLTKWLLTLLIGVATAHVAVLINLATSSLVSWKFHTLQALLGTSMHGMGVLFLVACNAWCVGIASLLTTFWAPASAGSGIPEIKSTLNGVHVKVWMSMDTLVCKIVGVILSVSGGLPVGKEGPMIHSASIIGAFFSSKRSYQGCGWRPVVFLQEKDVRDLVTCGAAAGSPCGHKSSVVYPHTHDDMVGVAAAFGAPIGGVLFALEEGASFLSPKLIWRAFFCAMGGVLGAIFNQINKCIMYRTQLRQLPLPLKVVYVMGVSVGLSVVWYFLSAFIGTCQTMPPAISTTEKARLVNHVRGYPHLFLAPQDAALKQRERVGTLLAELELHPQQMCWAVVERRYDLHTGQPEKVLEGTIQRNVLVRLLHQKATWNPFSCADHESDRTNVHVLESDHEDAVPLDMSKFSMADRECFVNLEFYVNPSPGLINGAFPLVVSKRGELMGVVTRDEMHALAMGTIPKGSHGSSSSYMAK